MTELDVFLNQFLDFKADPKFRPEMKNIKAFAAQFVDNIDKESWLTIAVKGTQSVVCFPNTQKLVNIHNPFNNQSVSNVHPVIAGAIISVIFCSHESNRQLHNDNAHAAKKLSKNYQQLRQTFLRLIDACLYPKELQEWTGNEFDKQIQVFKHASPNEHKSVGIASEQFFLITQ